jgi:hypothetical protein
MAAAIGLRVVIQSVLFKNYFFSTRPSATQASSSGVSRISNSR